MSKDMIYAALMENMKGDCCPVCELINARIMSAMDEFLYESVNDDSSRQKLVKDGGLCFKHASMLENRGDPLAHAIIYSDLIKNAQKQADSFAKKPLKKENAEKDCVFCEKEYEMEKIYCAAFVKSFCDEEFKAEYKKSGMLCVRHLRLVTAENQKRNSEIYKEIISATKEKYDKLLSQLNEIKRKNDYRFSAEPWSKDAKDSWRRAVAVINGELNLKK